MSHLPDAVPSVAVDQLPTPLPEGLTVLDVREQVEWQHGHLAGSLHVPMSELAGRLAEVPTEGQLLVVCKVGGRSARVVQYLVQQGVDAVNLDGGLVEWEAAGRPLVAEVGDPTVV
jgi:rhodanese-related sulfurtransferase